MKLIDADTVRDDFANTIYLECADDKDNNRANRIITAFDDLPTIEAGPVRHGEWLDSGINGTVSCSLCKFTDFFAKQNRVMLFKYCPGCGAKMEGGIPDETIHNKK